MLDRKTCPVRHDGDSRCEEAKCAWWNEKTKCCAVLDIAKVGYSVAGAVHTLDHYGRDV